MSRLQSSNIITSLIFCLFLSFLNYGIHESCASELVEIEVCPTIRRQIAGISRLDRNTYFAICDPGRDFDQRIDSPERLTYLIENLNATFGRALGPIKNVASDSNVVRKDPQRPGFVDLGHLKEKCQVRRKNPSKVFSQLVGGSLDVVAHGSHNAFPNFMGNYTTSQLKKNPAHPQYLPKNLEAAAELSAAILEHGYTDFDRPSYYEPINEPHWSFISNRHLADWHVKTKISVQTQMPNLKVGGPCSAVAYYYRDNYKAFDSFKQFICNTNCDLDFYSFHVYDYLNWNGHDLAGRVTSGLPLEGVLDLLQAHTVNEYGKQVDLVVSEHGGYVTGSKDHPSIYELEDLLAKRHFPDSQGFDGVIRKRSISSHVLVSSAIANTLVFMDHPHVIKKAVPFIMLETMEWNPKYPPTLYVAYGFTDKSRWVETRNSDFYKFFRDLHGERVLVRNQDPDLQSRAFVHGNELIVIINNLANERHFISLKVPKSQQIDVRRYGRNRDFTSYLTEQRVDSLEALEIVGREAVLIKATYSQKIAVESVVNEMPYYGDTIAVQPKKDKPASFIIELPSDTNIAYATLRISVSRPHSADPDIRVLFNGENVDVPLEDSFARLDNGEKEYASTKFINIDRSIINEKNRVEVSFLDEDDGAIGGVALRVGVKR